MGSEHKKGLKQKMEFEHKTSFTNWHQNTVPLVNQGLMLINFY